jgi:hypothetical protein
LLTNQGLIPFFATYYGDYDTIGTDWKQYTLNLKTDGSLHSLAQPDWAADERHPLHGDSAVAVMPLDLTKAAGIEWVVSVEKNLKLNQGKGTLWVDNVVVHNYKWSPVDACLSCVTNVGEMAKYSKDSVILFSDMTRDGSNFLNKDFYIYNDAEGRNVTKPITDFSYIDTACAVYPPMTPTIPDLKLTGTHGQSANDTAAWINFTLGPKYLDTSMVAGKVNYTTISPFVGIGSMLSNDNGTSPYNAAASGVTGVYFEYQTTGTDMDWVSFEAQSDQVFPVKDIAHHLLLPTTGGAWKGAIVPFGLMVLPADEDLGALQGAMLKSSALTKFQWEYAGGPGQTGTLAVDNVYLLKINYYNGVSGPTARRAMTGFEPKVIRRAISYTLPSSVGAAEVRLVDMHGRMLATQTIDAAKRPAYTLRLPGGLAKGVYLLVVTNKHMNYSAPVTIMK